MVSCEEYNQISLRTVCGWLKIQLTGNGERVQSITLRGNNGEQVAGEVYINAYNATSVLASDMGSLPEDDEIGAGGAGGGLQFDDTIFTELTLNCGEGVVLGSAAKSFYIAVPPQTFEKGFTVEVECNNGTSITKSTSEPITIERNHIKPMASIAFEGEEVIPYNEIHYTATAKVEANSDYPWSFDTFGANVVSNEWNSESGEGVITFGADVTTIGDNAFMYCEALTSVTIPDSVATIGDNAFYCCYSLTSVTIGDSVTTIGNSAFYGCDSLTSVTIPDSVTTIGGGAFYGCDSLTSVTIPDSVTTIGDAAFAFCYSLTSITIPDSVTTIGGYAFQYCDKLTSVTIGDSVTTIGDRAFSCCSSLTSVTIPDSVTTIGGYAFYECRSLTSVTIPDSVTTIGNYAFYWCTSLTSVYCEATTPPSLGGNSVFDFNASGRKIYVPAASAEAYKAAAGWSVYASYIVGYDFE